MSEPIVSVVMSVYNGERYLREAVDSILAQTLADFEFIIINDGSTDGSSGVIRGYDDPRIKLIEQENTGLTPALNRAFSVARGRYVARMDADDIAMPDRFEKQLSFLTENENVAVVGSAYHEIDASGRVLATRVMPENDGQLRRALIRYNPFCHGAVMIDGRALRQAGGYDPAFIRAQDYDLWFRISLNRRLANLREPLLKRRYSSEAISIALEREQIRWALVARFRAIKRRQYGWIKMVHLVRPVIALLVPGRLRWFIRRHFLRSGTVAETVKE